MSKINFKDYLNNYEDIKKEEKNTKKINELNYQKELAKEINQKYFELKEYLDILKNNLNTSCSINEIQVLKNISDNINKVQSLISDTYYLCKKNKIFANVFDTLEVTIRNLLIFLIVLLIIINIEHFLFVPGFFQLLTALGAIISDILYRRKSDKCPILSSGFKAIIGLLPFNNRYSFVKNLDKLDELEDEYQMLGEQYAEYLEYLESHEKSEVAENIIKTKEVKDIYLLEITKLIDKVKELPLGEDREKYLEVLEKLTELYKREKERIILKNGYVHSEEERELGISVIKQLVI